MNVNQDVDHEFFTGKTQIALILCVASENNCDLDVLSPCVQELVTSYKLSAFITKVCSID